MSNNQLAGLFNLEGQTALITGSTRGIGFALACGLGQAGAHVLINGRSADAIQKVVDELNSRSIAATGLVADVTQQDEISAQIERYESSRQARNRTIYRHKGCDCQSHKRDGSRLGRLWAKL